MFNSVFFKKLVGYMGMMKKVIYLNLGWEEELF